MVLVMAGLHGAASHRWVLLCTLAPVTPVTATQFLGVSHQGSAHREATVTRPRPQS